MNFLGASNVGAVPDRKDSSVPDPRWAAHAGRGTSQQQLYVAREGTACLLTAPPVSTVASVHRKPEAGDLRHSP